MKFLLYLILASAVWWNANSQARDAQDRCQTPSGQIGTCVTVNDCPPLLTVIKQKPFPNYLVPFLRRSHCGFKGNIPKVCCGSVPQQSMPANIPSTSPATTISWRANSGLNASRGTPPPLMTSSTGRPPSPASERPTSWSQVNRRESTPNKTLQGEVERAFKEDSSPSPNGKCGRQGMSNKIFGGQYTDLDEFPWMALLGYAKGRALTYQCGGALINLRYVLTAAHCLGGQLQSAIGKLTSVRLGEYDIKSTTDCVDDVCADPTQDIAVHKAILHPGYVDSGDGSQDDIGLIRLAKRATYTFFVRPLCLPSSSVRVDVGHELIVAGWGKTEKGINTKKLKVRLPIIDHNDCVRKYQRLVAIGNKQLCAGGVANKDACAGDSGGPLMRTTKKGAWEAVGVVSFGNGCGKEGWPGVYTSVANYTNWIVDTLISTNN